MLDFEVMYSENFCVEVGVFGVFVAAHKHNIGVSVGVDGVLGTAKIIRSVVDTKYAMIVYTLVSNSDAAALLIGEGRGAIVSLVQYSCEEMVLEVGLEGL
jgi:hypothetical protein